MNILQDYVIIDETNITARQKNTHSYIRDIFKAYKKPRTRYSAGGNINPLLISNRRTFVGIETQAV